MPERIQVQGELARLVAWPTISDRSVLDLAAHLATRAEDAGFRVTRYEAGPGKVNVVARAGPADTEGLVLSGHMDVVPVEGQDWSSDPFTLTERGDALYARGACDMKGFLAAAVTALQDVDVARLSNELVLVWTCDEELGCVGAESLVTRMRAEGERLPRACVIGEPTSFRILRLHPGHCSWRVVVEGKAAHSGRPSLGASAIRATRHVLAALDDLADELARERAFEDDLPTPHATVNVGTIRGGTAVNIIPDRCELIVGIRQLPGQAIDEVERRLVDRMAEVDAALAPTGCRVGVARVQVTRSMLSPCNCAHLPLLERWASDPRPTGAPFATDGGALAEMGVESLIFGPGSIDVAHRADEHVPTAELHRAVDVVRDLVARRCLAAPSRPVSPR
jgi:acetylornithine deacetylase